MVVLDTNALVFDALKPARLSRRARTLIERAEAEGRLACSDISLWEIAMLVSKGRLDPGTTALEFLRTVIAARGIQVLPVNPEIAELSVSFSATLNADPADRLIAATAVHHQATLITTDANLREASLPIAVFC
jgi:PIN domain nuclease of toxin-antitoxin system